MGYWTKDRRKEVTDKYTVLMEFRNNESACHAACRANGWLDELCDHMSVKYKPSGYWTIENVAKFIDDSKIEVRQDLKKFKPSLFNSCIKKGWMDELFKNKPNKGLKIKVKDVTKDQAYEKSILCKTRRDFSVSFPLEYKASFRNGWLDEFIPFTPGQQGIGRKPTHKGPNGKFIKKD